jgi:translation initiation factor 3 subunit A
MQATAHRAFKFCKQYKRKTEFRRLCGIIRNHLANLIKYRDQPDQPDLSSPDSLQLYLRFDQLKIAAELELWQVGNSHFSLHLQGVCFILY